MPYHGFDCPFKAGFRQINESITVRCESPAFRFPLLSAILLSRGKKNRNNRNVGGNGHTPVCGGRSIILRVELDIGWVVEGKVEKVIRRTQYSSKNFLRDVFERNRLSSQPPKGYGKVFIGVFNHRNNAPPNELQEHTSYRNVEIVWNLGDDRRSCI